MLENTDGQDRRLAFPPPPAPAYLTLGRLVTRIGDGPDGKPLMNRQTAELIALSGAVDVLIARSRGLAIPAWDAVVADDKGKLLVHAEGVEPLRTLDWVDLAAEPEPVFNVRVRPGHFDDGGDPERSYMGWHARMTDEEARLAVTRWWNRPREDMRERPFVATIAGLCVYVGRIRDINNKYGLAEFTVDTIETELRDRWLFHRVRTPPGGNTAILRPAGSS
ncbi:hypothetical protein [Brevibacterium aurantiacum]|uniref:Uncharacterized protein n=1 Tax=Brevibacterium aurantiacum TaxID=273384 RepID=A0A2A3Z2Y1_BREAU|nr:hypothetical protein [Brevibacterium aurantiacum]PCC45861.1 hypothetical protein CIK64_14150 [Brevibacterium aurantiacum]